MSQNLSSAAVVIGALRLKQSQGVPLIMDRKTVSIFNETLTIDYKVNPISPIIL